MKDVARAASGNRSMEAGGKAKEVTGSLKQAGEGRDGQGLISRRRRSPIVCRPGPSPVPSAHMPRGSVEQDDIIEVLKMSQIFGELPPKRLQAVRGAGKEISFEAGEELVVQGEEGGRYFLILDGEADVHVHGALVGTVRRGDGVGEVALLDGGRRGATVTARTPVRTFSLVSWHFKPLLAEPDIAAAVIRLLCDRLRKAEAAEGR